jgi:hypothetical protein
VSPDRELGAGKVGSSLQGGRAQRRDRERIEPEAIAAVASAEERERVRFAVHSAEALDVPRRRFDLALCGWSL